MPLLVVSPKVRLPVIARLLLTDRAVVESLRMIPPDRVSTPKPMGPLVIAPAALVLLDPRVREPFCAVVPPVYVLAPVKLKAPPVDEFTTRPWVVVPLTPLIFPLVGAPAKVSAPPEPFSVPTK